MYSWHRSCLYDVHWLSSLHRCDLDMHRRRCRVFSAGTRCSSRRGFGLRARGVCRVAAPANVPATYIDSLEMGEKAMPVPVGRGCPPREKAFDRLLSSVRGRGGERAGAQDRRRSLVRFAHRRPRRRRWTQRRSTIARRGGGRGRRGRRGSCTSQRGVRVTGFRVIGNDRPRSQHRALREAALRCYTCKEQI